MSIESVNGEKKNVQVLLTLQLWAGFAVERMQEGKMTTSCLEKVVKTFEFGA